MFATAQLPQARLIGDYRVKSGMRFEKTESTFLCSGYQVTPYVKFSTS